MYKALSILLPVVQQAVRLTSRTTTDVRTSDPYPGARHFALCTPRKHIHTRIDAYISRRQGGWDPQGRTYDIHKAPLFSTSIKIQGASFFFGYGVVQSMLCNEVGLWKHLGGYGRTRARAERWTRRRYGPLRCPSPADADEAYTYGRCCCSPQANG